MYGQFYAKIAAEETSPDSPLPHFYLICFSLFNFLHTCQYIFSNLQAKQSVSLCKLYTKCRYSCMKIANLCGMRLWSGGGEVLAGLIQYYIYCPYLAAGKGGGRNGTASS